MKCTNCQFEEGHSQECPEYVECKLETHTTCQKRIKEEGGKAKCCYCNPHKDCNLNQKVEPKAPTISDWEKEFDKKFSGGYEDPFGNFSDSPFGRKDIKDFIRTLLHQSFEEGRRGAAEIEKAIKISIFRDRISTCCNSEVITEDFEDGNCGIWCGNCGKRCGFTKNK